MSKQPLSILDQAKGHSEFLSLSQLESAPYNQRTISLDDPEIISLADSLKSFGQLQEILARPRAAGGFEIMAGHRRFAAAQLAKLPGLRAHVVEASDEMARAINAIENLKRAALSPFEEAAGVKALLDIGYDIAALVAHLGKTEAWIRMRAKLADLSPKWQKAIADQSDSASSLTVGHLELVARFEPEVQDRILGDDEGADERPFSNYDGRPMPLKEFTEWINREVMHDLSQAGWKVDDATLLPAAGACNVCPKRSSCQQTLFAEVKKGDRCLDKLCWDQKEAAHVARRESELREQHPGLVVILGNRDEAKERPDAVVGYDIKTVKKGTPGAKPAIVACRDQRQHGSSLGKAGTLVWVKESDYGADQHAKKVLGGEGKTDADGKAVKGKSLKERIEALAKRRARIVLKKFSERLEAPALPKFPDRDGTLMRLAVVLGTEEGLPTSVYHGGDFSESPAGYAKVKDPAQQLWQEITNNLSNHLNACESADIDVSKGIDWFCKLCGWDDELKDWHVAAAAEIPTPKALANDIAAAEEKKGGKAAAPKKEKAAKPKAAAKVKTGKVAKKAKRGAA